MADDEQFEQRIQSGRQFISSQRASFYERLALLDGGTIALSITLLGYLRQNGAATAPWHNPHPYLIKSSWAMLALGLIFAMARNLYAQLLHETEFSIGYWNEAAKRYQQKLKDNPKMEGASAAQIYSMMFPMYSSEAVPKHKWYLFAKTSMEWIACLATVCGLCLLILFAVKTLN